MYIRTHRHFKNNGFTLIELMIVISIIAILSAVMTPSFVHARGAGHLAACISNVKNIATACEMYSIDHGSKYPESLSVLTQDSEKCYLHSIPTCPAAGKDTYTSGYSHEVGPHIFTVRCMGQNHLACEVSGDFPLFDSAGGIVTRVPL